MADASLAAPAIIHDAERFERFCARHLTHLDEVTWEYFGTDAAREAIRKKVQVLFPEHEHDEFTEHFWQRIQTWREQDAGEREKAESGR